MYLSCFTRLPGNVMYFEQPQLAQWDSAKNNWRLDTFTDTQYNEGTPPLNGLQILLEIKCENVIENLYVTTYNLSLC